MPDLLARFHGELDTGWAEELRPVEHAAILLLADIADEVKANGEDGLRFDYTSASGRRYRMQMRIDEAARRAVLAVLPELPLGFAPGCLPALASRLNARVTSGTFDQLADGAIAFHSTAQIDEETEMEAIRRLVDATSLPLELFEVAARRMVRPCRGQRAR